MYPEAKLKDNGANDATVDYLHKQFIFPDSLKDDWWICIWTKFETWNQLSVVSGFFASSCGFKISIDIM